MESKREIFSLRRDVFGEDGRCFPLVYKLVEEPSAVGERYGIRCYVEGIDLEERPYDQTEIPLSCQDPEEALSLVERLAANEVMPIHIPEVLSEQFV